MKYCRREFTSLPGCLSNTNGGGGAVCAAGRGRKVKGELKYFKYISRYGVHHHITGAKLISPCLRCPATVGPGVSSGPCFSGPTGPTSPVTSGPHFHVVLFQVAAM